MVKAFLSHSSKDKGFVGEVVRQLGSASIEYDAMTFEEGTRTFDEIMRGIDDSFLFVFFISDTALNSTWVKKEIIAAEKYLSENRYRRFLPLLIDSSINYEDPRIPEWMRIEYNIKYISKVGYCSRLIKDALRVISWNLYPRLAATNTLYIGRNQQIAEFEQRLGDIDRRKPLCAFVCGLPTIGRRSYFVHVLLKTKVIKYGYKPRVINLNYRNSIEDFILHLFGFGYTSQTSDDIKNLIDKPMADKIVIAAKMLTELLANREVLIIDDCNCIVERTGGVAKWFNEITEIVGKTIEKTRLCVVSRTFVREREIREMDEYYIARIEELEVSERVLLFESLLDEQDIELSRSEIQYVSSVFNGYPEQVRYAVSLVKDYGFPYVKSHLHEIVDFSKERIEHILNKYSDNGSLGMQFLQLLSMAETLSLSLIEDVFGEDKGLELSEIIDYCTSNFVTTYVDSSKEYLRLNDSVKDYIQRLGIRFESQYAIRLENHIKKTVADFLTIERDTSDYVFSIKEALKNDDTIPWALLIPSHYVNAMRELYNYDKKYDTVIKLAHRILRNESSLDARIVDEIKWWLCLSLARKESDEFLSEVQYFIGADYNFLMGFFNRLKGNNNDAIERLNKALRERPKFNQAERELVQAFINTEDYGAAYQYAKDCYEREKTNPYFIQSYINCLVHIDGHKNKVEIQNLLEELKACKVEKAAEMYLTSSAYYQAFALSDIPSAMSFIDAAIRKYPNNKYPYLAQLEIIEKFNLPVVQLQAAIELVEKRFEDKNEIYNRIQYIYGKSMLIAKSQSREAALNFVSDKLRASRFSQRIVNDIRKKIDIYGL